MKKIVWMDVETTGLESKEHDIVELAIIIFIDNEPIAKKHWKICPFRFDNITPESTEVHGHTIEELKTFTPPNQVYKELSFILSKHVDKYDKNDKYYSAGFNARFDVGFLAEFFSKNGDPYFGSFFSWKIVDVFALVDFLEFHDKLLFAIPNRKLSTVCESFGIPINAHNAMSDIEATIKLYNMLLKILATIGKKDIQTRNKEEIEKKIKEEEKKAEDEEYPQIWNTEGFIAGLEWTIKKE